jgi:hypothetical protein
MADWIQNYNRRNASHADQYIAPMHWAALYQTCFLQANESLGRLVYFNRKKIDRS